MIEVLNRDFVNNNCDLKLFALHAHIFFKKLHGTSRTSTSS